MSEGLQRAHFIFWLKRLGFLGLATLAGLFAQWIGLPLPWMIGPLLLTVSVGLSGAVAPYHERYRPLGQLIVATAVGLYFTPDAMDEVAAHIGPMLAAAILTIAAGFVTAWFLYRMSYCDGTVAFYASLPGGPAEMATLAERQGAQGAPVVFAQTLRIVFIVLLIPPSLTIIGGLMLPVIKPPVDVYYPGLLVLYAIAIAGSFVLQRAGLPNSNFLAPVAVAATISAFGVQLSGVPIWLLACGQVLLGVALGTRFNRQQIRRDQRFAMAAVITTVILLAQCAVIAVAIWIFSAERQLPSYLLATAPGSVTEMALTAKLLGQGVAMVTAYHLLRIFIIIPLAPYLYQLFRRLMRNRVAFGGPDE